MNMNVFIMCELFPRYGRSLGLLKDEGTEELALLLKHSHLFLAAQRATTHPSILTATAMDSATCPTHWERHGNWPN